MKKILFIAIFLISLCATAQNTYWVANTDRQKVTTFEMNGPVLEFQIENDELQTVDLSQFLDAPTASEIVTALNTQLGNTRWSVVEVPAGGTTGQVLKKDTNTDFDYSWQDDGGSGGSVPSDTGSSNGDVLTTDGAGTYTWETPTGGSSIEVEDEGVSLTTGVTKFDFVGGGVTATEPTADEVTVTITDDQTASEVNITDSGGNYTGTTVEAALTEIADSLAVKSNIDPNSPIQTIALALADTQAELESASLGANTIGFSKDGGSTLSLNSLTDVTKGSPATNSSGTLRVLADPNEDGDYNEIDWTPPSGGGASELSDLSDVNTSTPTNRNVLVADGTDWESRPLVESDISDFGDYVDLTSTQTITGQKEFSGGVTSNNILLNGNQGVIIIPEIDTNAASVRYQTPISPLGKISPSDDQGITWFNTDGSFNIGYTDNTSSNRTIAFDFSGIGLTKRTYELPDASGTIALTSDLGGDVPDDTGSSDGDVLTTDGAGTFTWETPSGGSIDAIDVSFTPAGNTSSTNVQTAIQELQGDIDVINATPSFTTLTTYENIAALPSVTGSEADVYCVVTDDPSGDNGLYGIVDGAWEFLYSKHNPLAPFNRTSNNVIDEDDPNYQSGFDIDATGAVVVDAAKYVSGYIPVNPGDRFYGHDDFNRYALYDKDSVLIAVTNPPYLSGNNGGSGVNLTVNIPPSSYYDEGVRFIRFDGQLTDIGSADEIVRGYNHTSGGKSITWTDFDAGYTRDNENYIYEAEGVVIPKLSTNLYDYKRGNYTGGFLANGSASSNPSTGYIPVKPSYEYHHNYGSNQNISFFTSDFTYISGATGQSATAPSTARYMSVLIPTFNPVVDFNEFTITQGKRQVQISDVRTNTLENIFIEPVDVCLIGDSIGTEGEAYATYSAYGGVMADLLKYENYINMSVSGGSLRDYADKTVGFLGVTTPLADLYIVTLGTNDFGYNRTIGDIADVHPTDDTTFGDLDGIVDDILSVNANAKIAFITPLPRATQDNENVVDNLLVDYADAIIEFARENGYPVLDLFRLSQFEPRITTISENWTEDASDVPGDGLHPIDAAHEIYLYPHVAAFIKTNLERAKK